MSQEKNLAIRWLEHALVLGLSVMAVVVFANVVLRYLFDSGISVTEEVSRFIFVWLTFVGSVVALHQGLHLGMDALVSRVPQRLGLVIRFVSGVLMLACCALLFKGSWEQTRLNADNVSALSGIPVGLMYGVGIFVSTFMAWIILRDLWWVCTGKSSAKPAGDQIPREA